VGGSATDEWSWSSFGGRFGYPSAIVFHQQRMVLGGSVKQPQSIWGSIQGNIESFEKGITDKDAYSFTIAANKKNPIVWMVSNQFLNIGTLGGEFTVSSNGPSITPSDIAIHQIGQYGSAKEVRPLIANGFTIFCQAGGSRLRELRFDESSRRNFARDLNKLTDHIVHGDSIIKYMVYQAEPYKVIWVIVGKMLYALTYETDEEVYAWSKQDVGGEVVSIAVVPNGVDDRLWMVVKRSGKYYIEYLSNFFQRTDPLDGAIFLDSSLSYTGRETSILTGLGHLEGSLVSVLNNGSVDIHYPVVDGKIKLQFPTTKCTVGLPLKSSWQSMRFDDSADHGGVDQGKPKLISSVIFRLDATGSGLMYGKGTVDRMFAENEHTTYVVRKTTDFMDSPPDLLNGDTYRQPITGGRDPQYMLRLEHEDPVPCTVIGLILTVDTTV
jgi:hypothetical protein